MVVTCSQKRLDSLQQKFFENSKGNVVAKATGYQAVRSNKK